MHVDRQRDKLPSSFWEDVDPEARRAVGAWARSEPVRRCLVTALEHATGFERVQIAEAIKALEGVAAS